MPAPLSWNNSPVMHTTRHGWEVSTIQPGTTPTAPLARRGDDIIWTNNQQPLKYRPSITKGMDISRDALDRYSFGPPRFSSILYNREYVGYFFYGLRNNDIGLPAMTVLEKEKTGIASAVVMALFHGACAAGGKLSLLDVTNISAFQAILMGEGCSASEVHLVRNELLLDKNTLGRGIAAYPRKTVLLRDFAIERVPLNQFPPESRPFVKVGMPQDDHAWWVEKIVVCK